MTNHEHLNQIAKADEVADLLQHAGWQEVIKPLLLKRRNDLTTLLVSSVLGGVIPGQSGQALTKEQLAGYVFGIDEIIRVFERTLQAGAKSLEQLEFQGIHLNSKQS